MKRRRRLKGVERWGDIGRSRVWRKEASTRFDHSTDEASADWEHIIWILCYELNDCRRGIGQAAGSLRPRNGLRGGTLVTTEYVTRAPPTLGSRKEVGRATTSVICVWPQDQKGKASMGAI